MGIQNLKLKKSRRLYMYMQMYMMYYSACQMNEVGKEKLELVNANSNNMNEVKKKKFVGRPATGTLP